MCLSDAAHGLANFGAGATNLVTETLTLGQVHWEAPYHGPGLDVSYLAGSVTLQAEVLLGSCLSLPAAALDATPAGRVYSAHYLEETGPIRNIPGSVVDEVIDHGQIVEQLSDRTIYYDAINDVTVVQSNTTGVIMSARRGAP